MLMKLIQKHKKIKRKKEAPKKRNNEARKENRKQVIIFINYESTKIAEASRTEAPKPKLAVRVHQTTVFLRHDTLVQLLRKKLH